MDIKESISNHFKKIERHANVLMMIPHDGVDDSLGMLTYGGVDCEGYVKWRPKEVGENYKLTEIEKILGDELHKGLKDYLNSYWFITLVGFYEDYEIILDSVTPSYEDFIENLKIYQKYHDKDLRRLPIGIEGNGGLIVFDNKTGEVFIEDSDIDAIYKITDSLIELIKGLKVVK